MGTYDTLLLAFDMDERADEAESLWNMILHTHTRSIPRRLFARMIALYAHHDLHDKVIEVKQGSFFPREFILILHLRYSSRYYTPLCKKYDLVLRYIFFRLFSFRSLQTWKSWRWAQTKTLRGEWHEPSGNSTKKKIENWSLEGTSLNTNTSTSMVSGLESKDISLKIVDFILMNTHNHTHVYVEVTPKFFTLDCNF